MNRGERLPVTDTHTQVAGTVTHSEVAVIENREEKEKLRVNQRD